MILALLSTSRVAQEWLQTCIDGHTSRKSHSGIESRLPTRVIDVHTLAEDGSSKPRLVVGGAKRETIVALS